MAGSYYCPTCDVPFARTAEFNDCPTCGTTTLFKKDMEPISDREARTIVMHAKFERWCRANDWSEDPAALTPRIILPRDHSPHDGRIGWQMIEFLEDEYGMVPELHVFLSGLVPGAP